MSNEKSPIIVFTYNRPAHAERLLASLERSSNTDLKRVYIFCDGARSDKDLIQVNSNRAVVNDWVRRVGANIIVRNNNLGLAKSVLSGVNEFCDRFGRVIVLEDDLVVAPDFVQFMDRALDKYAHEPDVFQVSGYHFPTTGKHPSMPSFLPLTTSWGWATWKRAWQHYSTITRGITESPEKSYEFDLQGAYPYSAILKSVLEGKSDSWAIFWRTTVFNEKGLVLYPPRSLVWQGGFDGSGVHCGNLNGQRIKKPPLSFNYPRLPEGMQWPETVAESPEELDRVRHHLRNRNNNRHWASEKESLLKSALLMFGSSLGYRK
jgi:glycosyltransferase involved in cell wall biosynthesis